MPQLTVINLYQLLAILPHASPQKIAQIIDDAAEAGQIAPHLLTAARQMLLDPQKRAHYDQRLGQQLMAELPALATVADGPDKTPIPRKTLPPLPDQSRVRRPALGGRYEGRIARWYDERGFGWLSLTECEEEVFLHITAFERRQGTPAAGDRVSIVLTEDEKKRLRGIQAVFMDKQSSGGRLRLDKLPLAAGLCLLVVMLVGLLLAKPQGFVWWTLLVFNLIVFAAYLKDKQAAQYEGRRRVREDTLHFLGLLGGWPGALIAQQLLRHKTSKRSFQIVFWLTALLDCGAVWAYVYFLV